MKTKQQAIIVAERDANNAKLRAVLRGWGYRESEIQRFLREPRVDQKRDERLEMSDQSSRMPHSVS